MREAWELGKDIEADVWWVLNFESNSEELNPIRAAVVVIAKATEAFLGIDLGIIEKRSFYRIRATTGNGLKEFLLATLPEMFFSDSFVAFPGVQS